LHFRDPVENRLEDLRSLFDFIIPGYLGTPEVFKREFRQPIEVDRHRDAAEKLRAITAPFLLRRLKTDRTIISDLPDKVTINEYATWKGTGGSLRECCPRGTGSVGKNQRRFGAGGSHSKASYLAQTDLRSSPLF